MLPSSYILAAHSGNSSSSGRCLACNFASANWEPLGVSYRVHLLVSYGWWCQVSEGVLGAFGLIEEIKSPCCGSVCTILASCS